MHISLVPKDSEVNWSNVLRDSSLPKISNPDELEVRNRLVKRRNLTEIENYFSARGCNMIPEILVEALAIDIFFEPPIIRFSGSKEIDYNERGRFLENLGIMKLAHVEYTKDPNYRLFADEKTRQYVMSRYPGAFSSALARDARIPRKIKHQDLGWDLLQASAVEIVNSEETSRLKRNFLEAINYNGRIIE